ncbi:MAG: transcriptional regulator [endosymbiont of Seepiophila jonesi]|uniref:Transcriptional regulator n=1 Tax=endosymbiont of Lamellibrachia luymesi TaxID=2200907 RepID=A0A370DW04_9GAMM|nr:MAG: transcriptional regulator [endosymbiont of Lamellibrachia luymesi]RDH93647.1 MAG: transcriptional regulator [endosymbiont of Seepiophila jonesi]
MSGIVLNSVKQTEKKRAAADGSDVLPENGKFSGFGGWLLTLFVTLVLYSLRKRVGWMKRLLTVKFWFRFHMLMGVLGPTLVMLHSNFHLGSLNGRVALFSMITVAISGLAGRFVYSRIHYGLHGGKIKFDRLKSDSELLTRKLGRLFELAPGTKERLARFEGRVVNVQESLFKSFINWLRIRIEAPLLYKHIQREFNRQLKQSARELGWKPQRTRSYRKTVRLLIGTHKRASVRILELHFYERLFSLWHVMHLPLFFMMLVTGFIHIYAVHIY